MTKHDFKNSLHSLPSWKRKGQGEATLAGKCFLLECVNFQLIPFSLGINSDINVISAEKMNDVLGVCKELPDKHTVSTDTWLKCFVFSNMKSYGKNN